MALAITAKHVLTGIGNILPRGQPKEPAKTTAAAFCFPSVRRYGLSRLGYSAPLFWGIPSGIVLGGMDKYSLSERDICTKFITPALRRAGWDVMSQIR